MTIRCAGTVGGPRMQTRRLGHKSLLNIIPELLAAIEGGPAQEPGGGSLAAALST